MLKNYDDPRHRPITAEQVRQELAEKQRQEQAERERPVREAAAKLTETHRKLIEIGREAFRKQQPDSEWLTPASALGLRMSREKSKKFVETEGQRFVAENPGYFPCEENVDAIFGYLSYQKPDINIPDASCFKAAWLRLKELGLIKERPAETVPVVEAKPEPEPVEPKSSEKLTPGFDLITGAPKMWTEKELWHLSSADMKKAFKMWVSPDGTDRRPKIARSIA